MKGLILISLPVLLLFGCSKDSTVLLPQDKTIYKEIAYNSLSAQEKSTIINPDDVNIREGRYRYENGIHKIYIDRETIGYHFGLKYKNIVLVDNQKLISVRFNTTDDSLLGPIDVIINPFSKQAVGQTLRY